MSAPTLTDTAVMTYREALRMALREELARDERVFVMGEEVGVFDGAYKVTAGLMGEFGPDRVRDTPIAEEGFVGAGVGAAMLGERPVIEIMTINFLLVAMDQVVNHAAKIGAMFGGEVRCPLVIRTPNGAGNQLTAQHSQSLEAWFAHVPGLKVVAPATPADAYGLLRAAIRDDDPVLVFEHRGLYWRRGEVDEDAAPTKIGEAAIRRSGDDVTLIAISKAVESALEAADRLEEAGIDAEVVDVRSVQPLDLDLLAASVARTGRAVVVHEAVLTGGIGAEIAAALSERVFDELRAPVVRVGAPFAPVPASPALEALYAPGADAVVAATRAVVSRRTAVRGAV
jgi:pyruvate dehydrogenase E1 component beta subunit